MIQDSTPPRLVQEGLHGNHPKNHFRKHKSVDREIHIQTFTEAVKSLGQKEMNVLVYYGIAGIGKTSLRKELTNYLKEYNLEDQHPEVIWASVDLQLERHRDMQCI